MFQIRFRGLITHATVNGRNVAVLFSARNHTPTLMVSTADIIGTPTLTVIGDSPTTTCFSLRGNVEISNLVPGQMGKFIAGVPRLTSTTDTPPGIVIKPGNVRQEIVRRILHPDFHAFVELEEGQLFAEDWFLDRATFDGEGSSCIVRTTTYTTAPTGDPVITASGTLNPGSVRVRLDATVTIGNVESGINPPPPEEHYAAFLHFYDSAERILYPIRTTPCSYGSEEEGLGCMGESNLGIECSNTQYP
jgi:hypothetical protein